MFGISSDSPEANAAFAKKERLPFPLLTDQNDFLRKSFGIKGNVFGMLKGRQVSSNLCAVAGCFSCNLLDCLCTHMQAFQHERGQYGCQQAMLVDNSVNQLLMHS